MYVWKYSSNTKIKQIYLHIIPKKNIYIFTYSLIDVSVCIFVIENSYTFVTLRLFSRDTSDNSFKYVIWIKVLKYIINGMIMIVQYVGLFVWHTEKNKHLFILVAIRFCFISLVCVPSIIPSPYTQLGNGKCQNSYHI